MKLKEIFSAVVATALAMSLAGCGSAASSSAASGSAASGAESKYEKLNIRLSVAGTEQGVDSIVAQKFADDVAQASRGNVSITVYPNAQLSGGDLTKMMELFTTGGSYEMAVISGIVMSNVDQRFLAHTLPFEFSNYDEVCAQLDGTGGAYYSQIMNDMGIVDLGSFHNGLKQFTNNKKDITTPADMAGLKMRIPAGTVSVKTMQALGADPVAMAWSEVFTALQQGTVDGHENSYQTIYSANIQEVQKHVTELNWQYDGYWLMANQNNWSQYSPAVQELLSEKAKQACEYGRQYMYDQEDTIRKEFVEKDGVTITVLTDEQRQAFIDATQSVRDEFAKQIPEACAAWGAAEG